MQYIFEILRQDAGEYFADDVRQRKPGHLQPRDWPSCLEIRNGPYISNILI